MRQGTKQERGQRILKICRLISDISQVLKQHVDLGSESAHVISDAVDVAVKFSVGENGTADLHDDICDAIKSAVKETFAWIAVDSNIKFGASHRHAQVAPLLHIEASQALCAVYLVACQGGAFVEQLYITNSLFNMQEACKGMSDHSNLCWREAECVSADLAGPASTANINKFRMRRETRDKMFELKKVIDDAARTTCSNDQELSRVIRAIMEFAWKEQLMPLERLLTHIPSIVQELLASHASNSAPCDSLVYTLSMYGCLEEMMMRRETRRALYAVFYIASLDCSHFIECARHAERRLSQVN